MFEVGGCAKETAHLLTGQNHGETLVLFGAGNVADVPAAAERGFIEEAERAVGRIDEGTAEVSPVDGVMEKDADFGSPSFSRGFWQNPAKRLTWPR